MRSNRTRGGRRGNGIRARSRRGSIGESWWSGRFVAELERLTDPERLQRGRTYARGGQVRALRIRPGAVTARVQGTDSTPYRVRIVARAFTAAQWARVERALAEQAIYLAALLAGEMPREIEDLFAELGLSLFPSGESDLASSCTCPDESNPCKHIAATAYLLAERFDDDPFQIFAWRGRSKEELLSELRDRRARLLRNAARQRAGTERMKRAERIEKSGGPSTGSDIGSDIGEGIGRGEVADRGKHITELPGPEASGADAPPLESMLHAFWQAGAGLEEAAASAAPEAAPVPDALLRQLGLLGLDVRGTEATTLLSPAYRVLTTAAARRALGLGSDDQQG